ncbi:hypothetical protein GJ688_11870 [Heliobacillus mobilis]|uniref:Uncharacterized protein n=1 Tax=Heliobacterium mobile TaxID=28064 RepID=A0A6I3SM22_HELMO|nr:hypothetical protein [Heliobacterium mobile]MTV49672.1 hypothetical protein [Heliobacterium mobile]
MTDSQGKICGPYLSVVATARNDNHGGNFKERMQLFIDGLLFQSEKYQIPVELIIVEWNPPVDQPPLHGLFQWPATHPYCTVRFIEVPREIHRRYRHAEHLPLYQMIAKNVGVRRARGEYILCTNIDILFADELFRHLGERRLEKGKLYRATRYDVDLDLSKDISIAQCVDDLSKHIVRVNDRGGSSHLKTGERFYIYPENIEEIYPVVRSFFSLLAPFFTNACGDLQLMHRDDWYDVKGYPELDMLAFHLDSLFHYLAISSGLSEEIFPDSMCIYHIEHTAGWSPEAEKNKSLDQRYVSKKITRMTDAQINVLGHEIINENPDGYRLNGTHWGLVLDQLPQTCLLRAHWDRQSGNQGFLQLSPKEAPYGIADEQFDLDDFLLQIDRKAAQLAEVGSRLGADSFREWLRRVLLLEKQATKSDTLTDERIARLVDTVENKKLIIFGTGMAYRAGIRILIKRFGITPSYILDNSPAMQGKWVDGLEVRPPAVLMNEQKDDILVLIASSFYEDIKAQLSDMGLLENQHFLKIYNQKITDFCTARHYLAGCSFYENQ